MFSHFFIERPIFASVLSLVITLAGAVAVFHLPVAQFPQIAPPSIIVSCLYPGADARVVAESIAAPIEQQVNGVEDMLYMSSQSGNDGSYTLTVTFKPGVDLNFAQVLVQNRVNLALPLLPDVVKQAGVTTRKRSPDILQVICIYSPHGRYSQLYLSNYVTLKIKDELARVEGVGDVIQFGQLDYSMRVWLDPERLAALNLTAGDVLAAIREQNAQVAAGHFGQEPTRTPSGFEFPLTMLGRLTTPEEFGDIILKTDAEGRLVRLKNVGQVTLGARSLDVTSKIDGYPCTALAIFPLPYANSITTARRVREKMEELKKYFPEDLDYIISYDTAPFIEESVREVFQTLLEAILLVSLVVLLFLQNWRSAIIPLIAVPVAVVGTFAVMALFGFSLNNLTLFGLVLAIGIVVDDAIVVVEAIEHHIEEGRSPRAAAHQAMEEVSGPVVAVALVLSAVFVPCAFIRGITGQFFRQFALTIAVSTLLSAFNSLTLSPALAARLLPPKGGRLDPVSRLLDRLLGWFFRGFNRCFFWARRGYLYLVGMALRGSLVILVLYAGLGVLTWWFSGRLPTGYIPTQDMAKLYVAVQLPDSTSLERTQKIVDRVADIVQQTPGVQHTTAVAGQSFTLGANGPNFGNLFVTLEDFSQRPGAEMYSDAIAERLRARLAAEVPEALTVVFGPPPIFGLGSSGGFKLIVEDRSGAGLSELQRQAERLIAASRPNPKQPETLEPGAPQQQVANLFTVFRANTPQLYLDLDREQCTLRGVNPAAVFLTLQTYLGSFYVNDFNRFGRTWQVLVQAGGEFRNDPERIKLLRVRNDRGETVPLGAVARLRDSTGPLLIMRYNMYPAAAIVGTTRPEVSSGEGIRAMEQLCDQVLSPAFGYEWTEINYIQIDAARNIWNRLIFPLAVVFVFLVLAAQYESWALPLAVILVVPLCILAALVGVALSHSDINIFTQIGFVVLVGLASKNAILIVEFAKHQREQGLSRRQATLAACQLRLRPILMTSFAFILGTVPLLTATGAGAEMRRALGTAVFSGMLGVTLFGIFLTPVFFYVIEWFLDVRPVQRLLARSRQDSRLVRLTLLIGLVLGLSWLLLGLAPVRATGWLRLVSALLLTAAVVLAPWILGRLCRRRPAGKHPALQQLHLPGKHPAPPAPTAPQRLAPVPAGTTRNGAPTSGAPTGGDGGLANGAEKAPAQEVAANIPSDPLPPNGPLTNGPSQPPARQGPSEKGLAAPQQDSSEATPSAR
jgi:multidrug efflux pump